jgi:hypothetical protein
MGFSGGGSNVLLPHTHDGRVSQDGGALNFSNITQSSSAAGQMFYSDGTALQQLSIGAPNDEIRVSGANLPEWYTPAAASATWDILADVTLGAPGTLTSGTFSAQDRFIKVFFYGASVSSTTLGITCNASAGATEYATRFYRDFTTTGTAGAENSLFYFSGVATNEFCFMELEGYNGHSAAADKLFRLNTTANTTTGATACQSYENFGKYYGGSYITSFEMVDANPGTTINFQTGSRLLVLATG